VDFLTLFSSPEFTSQMVDAGGTPLATGALDREDIDPRLLSLMELMQNSEALIAPPDTGYDLEVADALYAAEAEVLGGVSTPEEAATAAQAKLGQ
jgi:raffinose/stachyose/melibiose transport system substrate-binding protein